MSESTDHFNVKKQDGGVKLVRAASSMPRKEVVGQSHTSFKVVLHRPPKSESTSRTRTDNGSVKFEDHVTIDSKDNQEGSPHDFYKQDETIRLFQSMPKGLEYFMAHGQPKQVKDYFDYIKLEQQHTRLLAELDMQKEPFRYRWLQIQEKKYKFLEDMRNFDKFLVDNERKSTKAKNLYVVTVIANRTLTRDIIIMKTSLSMHKNRLIHIEKKVSSHKHLEIFVSNTVKKVDTCRDFRQVMERHETLKNAYNISMYRFTKRQESLDQLTNLHHSRVARHKDKMAYMRQAIVDLKKKKFNVWSDNKHFADHVLDAKEKEVDKDKREFLVGRAIRNMAKQLMDIPMPEDKEMTAKNPVRSFTVSRLIGPIENNNLIGMIEAIGDIIIGYNQMLPKLQYDIKHPPKPKTLKGGQRSSWEAPKLKKKGAKVPIIPLQHTRVFSDTSLSQEHPKTNMR